MSIKLYAALTLIVLLLIGAGGFYAKGKLDASHAAQLAALQQEVNRARAAMELERKARVADAAQAKQDADEMAALTDRITELDEYVESLKDRDAECFSGGDTDRLRSLWGSR